MDQLYKQLNALHDGRAGAMMDLSRRLFSKDTISAEQYAKSHATRTGCTIEEALNFVNKVSSWSLI